MRTFIALPLPPETLRTLAAMQSTLRASGADVRWTAIDSIHLTLKFLGEVSPEVIPDLSRALRSSLTMHRRLALRAEGLGAFPSPGAPRIVWCGISGETAELERLQNSVEGVCCGLGFPPEERSFHPHLTLGRVKGKKNLKSLCECIRIGSNDANDFMANEVNLYKSTLTPAGALYEVLESFPLPG